MAVKRLFKLAAPEGLLLVAVVWLVHTRPAIEAIASIPGYAYAPLPFAVGVLLAWRFERTVIMLGLILMGIAYAALLTPIAETILAASAGTSVAIAVAVLLPLNLAALSLLADEGMLRRPGWVYGALAGAQLGLVSLLGFTDHAYAAGVLDATLLPEALVHWTPIAEPALLAFAAAFLVMACLALARPDATARGLLWALVAAFLALHAGPAEPVGSLYFAGAGLLLLVTTVESSHALAFRDGLTGLPARRPFNRDVRRLRGRYTVAMVDIDHFKSVNDKHGHHVGDEVLRMVATRMAAVSGGGKAFRYGGEEFAVLVPGKGCAEALPHLEQLRGDIEAAAFTLRARGRPGWLLPWRSRKRAKKLTVTVTIGASEATGGRTAQEVLTAADEALYRGKKAGRNRVVTG